LAGDFSAAVAVAYDDAKQMDKDNDIYKLKSYAWDYSVLGGYKITDSLLVYSSVFHSQHKYRLKIAPYEANQSRRYFSGMVDVRGGTLGIYFNYSERYDFTFEVVKSFLESEGSSNIGYFRGVNFSRKF